MLQDLLGASWRTTTTGIVLIILAAVFFYMEKEEQAVLCFVTGIGFLKTRDSGVSSQQQAIQPGLLNKAPDVLMPSVLTPMVSEVVEKKVEEKVDQKIEEVVIPKVEEIVEKKVDK